MHFFKHLAVTTLLLALLIGAFTSNIDANANDLISVPTGQTSLKIEVNETGIFEVTYQDFIDAGMNVLGVNPQTFQMMHMGETVHYQFVGDADSTFEPGESVRFYAWEYDGSRHDKQFVINNVYWLWAKGSGEQIAIAANQRGNSVAANWQSELTFEEDIAFSTLRFRWRNKPNDPDVWLWSAVSESSPFSEQLPLPSPDKSDASAPVAVQAEFTSVYPQIQRTVTASLGAGASASDQWTQYDNRNLDWTIEVSDLSSSGSTPFTVNYEGSIFGSGGNLASDTFLNRVTVTYPRLFEAIDNELIFTSDNASAVDYNVSGLSVSAVSQLLAWDISTRTRPVDVVLTNNALDNGVLHFGRNKASGSFIVTSLDNIKTPTALSSYYAPELEPAGGAEWIAVTHANFEAPTLELAAYRQTSSHMSTVVLDVEDVFNQFGYGFALPSAIHAYVQNGYDNWDTQPKYLLLVGDATQNPLQRECVSVCTGSNWDASIETFVPTDLVVEDRFLGLIPSDHTYTLLDGDDLIPDIAVGRISARSADEVTNVVNKIKRYEEAIFEAEAWTNNIMFLADNVDSGGAFCFENTSVDNDHVPDSYQTTHICMDDYFDRIPDDFPDWSAAVANMRSDIFNQIRTEATSPAILNYRGHGSINSWAGESLINRTHTDLWANTDTPTVILSADCLDSHFAWVETNQSLSETFLLLENAGSAAHWGSTGLGYSREHSVLHQGFYDAMHEHGFFRIGDVINDAKRHYETDYNYDESEIYAFTLHGDPAMVLPTTGHNDFAVEVADDVKRVPQGKTITHDVTIHNTGTLADTFIVELGNDAWNAALTPTQVVVAGRSSKTVTLSITVPANVADGTILETDITVESQALSTQKTATATTIAGFYKILLPVVYK